jgi:hypothetical protein
MILIFYKNKEEEKNLKPGCLELEEVLLRYTIFCALANCHKMDTKFHRF